MMSSPQGSDFGQDVIRTRRLVLRPARSDDLNAIHAVLSDPRAMRYWSSLPHDSLEQTQQWLDSMIETSTTERYDFIVEYDGQVIGKTGCWRLPEIGFILHPDHWGKGLAREALLAIIPEIFARFPVAAITADVDPRNEPSLALLKGLGFAVTGRASRTWKIGDEWCDSIYLALPRGSPN